MFLKTICLKTDFGPGHRDLCREKLGVRVLACFVPRGAVLLCLRSASPKAMRLAFKPTRPTASCRRAHALRPAPVTEQKPRPKFPTLARTQSYLLAHLASRHVRLGSFVPVMARVCTNQTGGTANATARCDDRSRNPKHHTLHPTPLHP